MVGFGQSQERAERLVLLSSALTTGKPCSLVELRDRFGLYEGKAQRAMQKMFERDREDLSEAGIAIETVVLSPTEFAYWILRRAAPVALSDAELDVLAVLSATVADPVTGAALATLAGESGQFAADHAAGRAAIDNVDLPAEILTGLVEGTCLQATYRDAKNNVALRTFEPWRLVHRRGLTYIVAWDVDRNDTRNFRLDRFDKAPAVTVGPATQTRPEGPIGPVYPIELLSFLVEAPTSTKLDAAEFGGTVRRVEGDAQHDGSTMLVEFPGFRSEPVLSWTMRHQGRVVEPADQASEFERRLQRLLDRHIGEPASVEVPATPRARAQTLSVERVRRLMLLPGYLAKMAGVTRDELARALGCSVAELDVELALLDTLELPGRGYVGEVEDRDGQLIYTRHEHRPEIELRPADAIRVLLLLEALGPLLDLPGDGLASILDKLRAVVPADISVEVSGDHHRDLPLIREAIADREAIRFEYKGRKDGVWRTRQVAPDQFRVAHGALYLAGVDIALGEERQFRLDRMGPVEPVGAMPVMAAESVTPMYVPTEPEVEVVLLLDHAASWLLTHITPVAVAEHDDGSRVVVVKTDAIDWLTEHVRAAGGTVEVVSPPEIRASIAGQARALLAR